MRALETVVSLARWSVHTEGGDRRSPVAKGQACNVLYHSSPSRDVRWPSYSWVTGCIHVLWRAPMSKSLAMDERIMLWGTSLSERGLWEPCISVGMVARMVSVACDIVRLAY